MKIKKYKKQFKLITQLLKKSKNDEISQKLLFAFNLALVQIRTVKSEKGKKQICEYTVSELYPILPAEIVIVMIQRYPEQIIGCLHKRFNLLR